MYALWWHMELWLRATRRANIFWWRINVNEQNAINPFRHLRETKTTTTTKKKNNRRIRKSRQQERNDKKLCTIIIPNDSIAFACWPYLVEKPNLINSTTKKKKQKTLELWFVRAYMSAADVVALIRIVLQWCRRQIHCLAIANAVPLIDLLSVVSRWHGNSHTQTKIHCVCDRVRCELLRQTAAFVSFVSSIQLSLQVLLFLLCKQVVLS